MAITFDSIGNGGLQEKFNMALRQRRGQPRQKGGSGDR